MRTCVLKHIAVITAVLAPFIASFDGALAAEQPTALKWAQLVPSGPPAMANKTFFAGSTRPDDASPPAPPLQEGKFMSMKRRQPGGDRPPEVVPALNGKLVSIGGYVVPLDFDSSTIKEFLLVPFVGACIHVPPPPANQIIYVKSETGIEITGQFDPVTVVGTIKTEPAFTGLADTGYSIIAQSVEPLKP